MILLLCNNIAFGQGDARNFRSISVDKGLSQSTVYTVAQDPLGFIWMGTQDGLNRYDGKGFAVFRPSKTDPNSIQSYNIRCLVTDQKGRLWIGGNEGVSLYDYHTNKFTNYRLKSKPGEWFISSIIETKDGTIWAAGITGELFSLAPTANQFHRIKFSAPGHRISAIFSLCAWENQLLLGTGKGALALNISNNTLKLIKTGMDQFRILVIFADGNNFWIGSQGGGITKLNAKDLSFVNYSNRNGTRLLISDEVRSIGKDAEGSIWIGTFKGLSILNTKQQFENYYHQPYVPTTISQNSIRCIYRDRQMGMWLGTFYGGVNYYHKNEISFNLLGQGTITTALNDNVVNVIKQDGYGNFWIGTNDKGLNYWNPSKRSISYFTVDNQLSSNNIKSIAFANNGNVLLGTHNAGLNVLDPLTKQVTVYKNIAGNSSTISDNMVYALLKDHAGRIWVGTRSGGLNLFDDIHRNFKTIKVDRQGKKFTSNEITYLLEDSRHRIWVGTSNGVNIFYPDNMAIEQLSPALLSSEIVNFIAEDKEKRIWIGTRDGLNLFDENTKKFITYEKRSNLPKGNINAILNDEKGDLWITTNTSLIKYNPTSGKRQVFDSNDGLQNRQFTLSASCVAANGMMLFGGIDGITYFYPEELNQNSLKLKVTFTGLELFNNTVTPKDSTGILNEHIDQTSSLQFNHEQKQFSILFNTFNYISTNRTTYFYKLQGFDKDWQETTGTSKATYTNLQPGKYTFYVKAVGPLGELSATRTLSIKIKPIWYKSYWFYFMLTVAIIGTTIFLYRVLTERLRALHQLKLERMQQEKIKYINQLKTDFFTNVSHELRTPLTLIMAPLEELSTTPVDSNRLQELCKLMLMSTKRLYQLVNQLFEFRKVEMGTRKLRVEKSNLVAFMEDVFVSFKPLAEKNEVKYLFESEVDQLDVLFDKDALANILYNLLSNAFKYTPPNHSITIRLYVANKNNVALEIEDTGIGIQEKHLERIFDRFYQIDGQQTNLGSGVGLAFTKNLVELHHGKIEVKSELGKGSIFKISLPINDSAYTNDERGEATIWHNEEIQVRISTENAKVDNAIYHSKNDQKTIMLVDDNHDIVNYLKNYFGAKYNLLVANSGLKAIELLENHQPDLIISDVMMPEMDGLSFCKHIKQHIATSHIPVILLTAKNERTQQMEGFDHGADDYLTKPFSISLLEAKIAAVLRLRQSIKDYYASSKKVEPEKIADNPLDQEFLTKAIKIIEDNLNEYDFSVNKLSQELNMSRANVYLKIKALTGESISLFIKRIKFKKVVGLLETRRYTISEISYMCGFNSPSYFSTAFKQFFGCMPTEYLERKDEG